MYRFKFPFLPVIILILHLFFDKAKRSFTDMIFLFASLYWLFFLDGGRSLIISLVLAYLFIGIYKTSAAKRVFLITAFSFISVLALAYSNHIFESARFKALNSAITAIYNPATAGATAEDISVISRVQQFNLIQSNFDTKTIFFGVGNLSEKWRNGFEGILGLRFHPSDLGALGAIYIYGIIITSIFFILYIRTLFRMLKAHDFFISTMLFFIIIFSIPTGYLVFNTSVYLLTLILREGNKNIPTLRYCEGNNDI